MSLFFDTMKAFLELIFAVGDETGIFGCPGWMGCPLIVQDGPTKLIAPTALSLSLLLHNIRFIL